jgi:WD40 repeat protein
MVNTAPDPPHGAVQRPEKLDEVKRSLLASPSDPGEGSAVRVTGIRGAGGFGKSTLAMMVAHDPQVNAHFSDGILWATIGEQSISTVNHLNDMVSALTGQAASEVTLPAASRALAKALVSKRVLLIIDDIWEQSQLLPFRVGGATTALLTTTRQADSLPPNVTAVWVDALTAEQSRELLLTGVPVSRNPPLDLLYVRDKVQQATGGWAVLLSIVNGLLRKDTAHAIGSTQAAAIARQTLTAVAEALTAGKITDLDPSKVSERNQAIDATMRASLDRLGEDEEARYMELAVFSEDIDIPMTVLEAYWATTAGWSRARTLRFCTQLSEMSLVADYTPTSTTTGHIRVHDVIREYLLVRTRHRLPALHDQILQAHRGLLSASEAWWELPASQSYLWTSIGTHLVGAGRTQQLADLLTTPAYLAAKLDRTGPSGVDSDFALLPTKGPVLAGIDQAIRQSGHLLGRLSPPGSLTATLASRLPATPDLDRLRAELQELVTPRLQIVGPTPDLPHPAFHRGLYGHSDVVDAVAVSPDGAWLATTSIDGTVRIWDPHTGTERHRLVGHTGIVTVAVAPDGTWMVCGGADGSARVWNTASGTELHCLRGHDDYVGAVAIAPGGTWLVSASDDGTARIWDPATGAERHCLYGHTERVGAAAVAPDGTWLVTASDDGTARIWDPTTGTELHRLNDHNDRVTAVAIAPDGRWLITASDDGTARIWDRATGAHRHCLDRHAGAVGAATVAADGTWAVTVSDDGTARIWDTATGAERQLLEGHTGLIGALAVAPDGAWLVTGGTDGTARIWDAAIGSERQRLDGHSGIVQAVAIAPDGTWLVTGGEDGTARIWNPSEGLKPHRPDHTDSVMAMVGSPSCTWLATGGTDGTVRIWDPTTGLERRRLNGHTGIVGALAVAPDAAWLVTGGTDGTARIWDPTTGLERRRLDGHTERVGAAAVAPDGTWLLTASDDRTARIWDPTTGLERHRLNGHSGIVQAVAIAPDGTWLVTGGTDGTARIWDRTTGLERRRLDGHTGPIKALAVAPDAAWLVTASYDGTARLWDPTTGLERYRLDGHTAWVEAVAVAPDGTWLVTASYDGTARIWDPTTGVERHRLDGHTDTVRAVVIAPGGTWVGTASDDGTARIWDPSTGSGIAAIRVDGPLRLMTMGGSFLICAGGSRTYALQAIL